MQLYTHFPLEFMELAAIRRRVGGGGGPTMKRSASAKLGPFAKVIQSQRLGPRPPDSRCNAFFMTLHCLLKSKYLHTLGLIIHVTCCLKIVAGISVILNKDPVASKQHVYI